jgi:TonB family protein
MVNDAQLCENRSPAFPGGEVIMQSPGKVPVTRIRATVVSVALHGALLASVVFVGTHYAVRLAQPVHPVNVAQFQVAGGSHKVTLLLPEMKTAAHTKNPEKNAEATHKTILPIDPQIPQRRSGGGAPPKPTTGKGAGQASQGNGSDAQDADPAFPVFSPRPPVHDRALLPASERKIIIDVNVDELGSVVSETLVNGLGNQLDQLVLDTVKTWRFHPATVNGKAVPTQAELVFPFNPNYPISAS